MNTYIYIYTYVHEYIYIYYVIDIIDIILYVQLCVYIMYVYIYIYIYHLYCVPCGTEMLTVLLCHLTMNSCHRFLLIHVPRAICCHVPIAKIRADSTLERFKSELQTQRSM